MPNITVAIQYRMHSPVAKYGNPLFPTGHGILSAAPICLVGISPAFGAFGSFTWSTSKEEKGVAEPCNHFVPPRISLTVAKIEKRHM